MKKIGVYTSILTGLIVGLTACGTGGTTDSQASSSDTTIVESASETEHDHNHSHTKTKAAQGIFEDSEVKDRALSDWAGEWQSVFPYLEAGALDDVFEHKAEDGEKTAEEYKEYYTIGYQTEVEKIDIYEDLISFYQAGEWVAGSYKYAGYQILTYESGKKGVRYLFDKVDGDDAAPKAVQFSDHIIAPEKSAHYHIYFGDTSQEELLKEMDNWPTYYPASLSADDIAHEMLYH
ncbi:metal-binding protein ZinT [uncultured Enterococcus sp.]|uniref:metal-binding protein ZinT n=1 Tax=uncultured Enterococcus sp. TaxID=167972 RepID=UPI002AA626E3|nr:metal-binding protein ZinT [uncultured Enterococcus sp.]